MALPPPKNPTPIPLDIPPSVQPVYANLARISHAPAEFVLDFARLLPGDMRATVMARVVMTPVALKLFIQAATENLARFENTFGPVNLPTGSSTLADHLFRPFQGPGPENPPDKDSK